MDRYALFVDAGYVLAAGGVATLGQFSRSTFDVDYPALVDYFVSEAAAACPHVDLLRTYWYDAAPNRQPTTTQLRIDHLPDTKLRLGQLTSRGDQKGVDGLILSDLTTLARERSIVTAILVAGDGDLVEAVAQAQRHGVRVLLWAISTAPNTLSPDLRREADRVRLFTGDELRPFFTARPAPAPDPSDNIGPVPAAEPASLTGAAGISAGSPVDTSPPGGADRVRPVPSSTASGAGSATIKIVNSFQDLGPAIYATIPSDEAIRAGRDFGRGWAAMATAGDLRVMELDRPRIPGEIDTRLIRYGCEAAELASSTRLAQSTLHDLRQGFWEGVDSKVR